MACAMETVSVQRYWMTKTCLTCWSDQVELWEAIHYFLEETPLKDFCWVLVFARSTWPGMPEWLFGQQTHRLWVGMCLTWHTSPYIWCMCAKPWGLMRKNLSGYGLAPGFCPRHEQLCSLFCFSFPAFAKMFWRLFRAKTILLLG